MGRNSDGSGAETSRIGSSPFGPVGFLFAFACVLIARPIFPLWSRGRS